MGLTRVLEAVGGAYSIPLVYDKGVGFMAEPRHLSDAPITEAVIDFRVKLPQDFQVERLSSLKEKLAGSLPRMKKIRVFETKFGLEKGEPIASTTQERQFLGFRFESEDGLNVAQFRIDGFTFSRLKPYTSWDKVFPEAYEWWNLYVEAASPEFVTRIAVRYINRLDLPQPVTKLTQYLTASPEVPDGVPTLLSSFLTRVVVHEEESGITANITQSLERDPSNRVTIILDIDVYKEQNFKTSDAGIKLTFKKLREMKNKIFFSSITEKAAELFE